MREWLRLACRPSVVRRASMTAAIVGTILAAINHGDALLKTSVDAERLARILLTYFVPYAVSTASSVGALRSVEAARRAEALTAAEAPPPRPKG